jgi:hypothetical protein
MDQLDLIARLAEMADQLVQCPRDPVDLGKVRFSDQRHAHGQPDPHQFLEMTRNPYKRSFGPVDSGLTKTA